MEEDVTGWTLARAMAALKEGDGDGIRLCRAFYERAMELEPRIGAYLHLEEPSEASRDYFHQEVPGVSLGEGGIPARASLQGLPISVKDNICVRGMPLTCGSRILEGFVAPYDATVVERLRRAGAVFLGKTNLDEFAMGSSTESSAYGSTRNPWDLERVPGGSSGGSAAAVAAGTALAALGSDTGGSVRQPAAFCGVVGLKPTYGRVSRFGLVAFASSLDQIGTLTRTVEDAAILLGIISGHDPRDSTSSPLPAEDFTCDLGKPIQGLRMGVPDKILRAGLHPEVRRATEESISRLEKLGALRVPIRLCPWDLAVACYYVIATAEASANLARFDGIRYGFRGKAKNLAELYRKSRSRGFGSEVQRRILLGTYVLSSGYYDAYYLEAQKVRTLIRQEFDTAFQNVDFVVMPVTPEPAFRLGERLGDPLKMYLSDVFTVSVNLAGIPGLVVPCGMSEEGLPIGVQILSGAFSESLLLQVGHLLELECGFRNRRPDFSAAGSRPDIAASRCEQRASDGA